MHPRSKYAIRVARHALLAVLATFMLAVCTSRAQEASDDYGQLLRQFLAGDDAARKRLEAAPPEAIAMLEKVLLAPGLKAMGCKWKAKSRYTRNRTLY